MTDPSSPARKAVVLAAGRGSRMAASSTAAPLLDPGQQAAADRGLKVLMPFNGHPFLSYVLSALADGGIDEACLVVGPGDDPVRRSFEALPCQRLRLAFAVQERPLGSAHALAAAAGFAGSDPIVMVNGDNLYPPSVVDAVRRLPGDGLAGFRASALSRAGGISRERVAAFALISVRADGCLDRLLEKPAAADAAAFGADPLVSMNCWRFTPPIFAACAGLAPSPRGECELTDAVRQRVGDGACFQVLPVEAAVLDLTHRDDIPGVEARLGGWKVRL
jgi:dTDP-glucose pyrophosphorylase